MHKCKMFSLLVHMIAVYQNTVQALPTPVPDVEACLKNCLINIIKQTYMMFFNKSCYKIL